MSITFKECFMEYMFESLEEDTNEQLDFSDVINIVKQKAEEEGDQDILDVIHAEEEKEKRFELNSDKEMNEDSPINLNWKYLNKHPIKFVLTMMVLAEIFSFGLVFNYVVLKHIVNKVVNQQAPAITAQVASAPEHKREQIVKSKCHNLACAVAQCIEDGTCKLAADSFFNKNK